MESVFTPNLLRARRLSQRLFATPIASLVGTRLCLGSGPDGFDDIVQFLRRDVGDVVAFDDKARAYVIITLRKYDFADILVTMDASVLARHGARCGVTALREFGMLGLREGREDGDEDCDDYIFDMYEQGVSQQVAYAHIFARAKRSWWSRAIHGDKVRGRLPAKLVVERGFVSNCSVGPWPFGYL